MNQMSKPRALWRFATAGIPSYLSWFIVNLILACFFPLLYLLRRIGFSNGVRRFSVGFLRIYFFYVLPQFGLYRISKASDFEKVKQLKQGMVMSNHTSWLDALIVIALVPNIRPLVSSRYGKVPLVGHIMLWLGCIFVDRMDRRTVSSAVDDIRFALRRQEPVAVFPEGTRAELGHLRPFQDVFFAVAVDEQCAVEPLLLVLDIPFLGPGTQNLVTPRPAELTIFKLDTIIPEPGEKGRDLAFRTRRAMRKQLKAIAKQRDTQCPK